jgi:hypothetical protein
MTKDARDEYARGSARDARFLAFARKKQDAAHNQRLERWRAVDRWRGRLVAGLLYLENCAQRGHVTARDGIAEVCDKFCLSGLGAD